MCEKCVRRAKHLGLPSGFSYGKVKFYAHRFMRGEPIPLFNHRGINYAIEAHVHKIEQAKSKRKENYKNE